jgi:hypothetical protein
LDISKAHGLTSTTCNYFFENLQSLYNKHNYLPDHIWNYDETCIHVNKQFGTWVLAKGGSQQVYSTIPKSREWMIVNCAVNVVGGVPLGFYIFKGQRIKKDYIQQCKPKSCMTMQKKTWMTCYLFKQFLSFFIWLVPRGLSQQNKHFIILNGHGSHVIFKSIKQAYEIGLDMITLPSHISHVLQPLDVMCFKPFKFAFGKERDEIMSKNKHTKPNKVRLASWVDRALN